MQAENQATTFAGSLNAPQRAAATHGVVSDDGVQSGPLLIIAGAGTGKTNTLAHRVAHLLLQGTPPERIALMTFSRRAAVEMLSRAERITGEAIKTRSGRYAGGATRHMWSGTFHSIANRLLREYASALGLEPAFSVIDRGDSGDLMDIKRQELGFAAKHKRFPRKDTCIGIYSHRVNTCQSLQDTLDQQYPWCANWSDELTELCKAYVEAKQQQALLDYDDLLLYWHALMQEPSLAADIGSKFDHVLVDEYQDTNILQAEILLAMKPHGDGLCVVGDDAQSIYSFRAATVDNILEFPSRFTPTAEVVTLEQNYRSTQSILDAANTLMAEGSRRFDKNLFSKRGTGSKPRYVTVEDTRDQAGFVVNGILARREQGVPLRQQAVLMRKAHDSDVLELELVRRDIPYVKYGGLKFLEAAHVKDVLAVLRFIDNPRNRIAGFRALQLLPGIGPATADECLGALDQNGFRPEALLDFQTPAAAAEEWLSFAELIVDLHHETDWVGQMTRIRTWYEPHLTHLYESADVRVGDIEQLEAIAIHHPSRERFLTELTLDPPQASSDEAGDPHKDEDYLILSTVHSAKGQEWHAVSVLNVSDGTFPNEFSTDDPAMVEEERRLLYVAMTRAKSELDLVVPLRHYVTQQHKHGDKHLYGARSRFVTSTLLERLQSTTWPEDSADGAATRVAEANKAKVDVGAKMRAMWD